MAEFATLIGGLSFAEGPRWHEGRIYFSDMYAQRVLAVGMDGAAETEMCIRDRCECGCGCGVLGFGHWA